MLDLANRISDHLADPESDRLNGETAPARADGRDSKGRFAKGNLGGPGRPPKARELKYLAAIVDAVGLQRFQYIVDLQASRAEQGDLRAAQFIARLLLGATPPSLSEVPEEELPDPAEERYMPPGPNLEALVRRARLEALVSVMSGKDVEDDLAGL
jgi:hypothetical protein